jgi:O-6-methylguanine DNA methyltransferase
MFYTILDFPLGKIFLAKSEKGLSFAISLRRQNRFEEISEFFKRKSIPLELQSKKFRQEEKLFSQYFEGEKEDFTSLPLDFISGTPYQRKVWLETRKIPYGKTRTYKSIAEKLNHKGYRSIGQALSRNPLLIVIPCHRVISSDGSLGGFTGGLELKKFLLRIEKQ